MSKLSSYELRHNLSHIRAASPVDGKKSFRVTSFKKTGKYYDQVVLVVPEGAAMFEVAELVRTLIVIEPWFSEEFDFHIQPLGDHDYPHIVHSQRKVLEL